MNLQSSGNQGLRFLKMHGLGNDFVIIDARAAKDPITGDLARLIGHRCFGVGFDQLAVLKASDVADVDVEFWNSDGSTAGACGNASRCIGRLLIDETGRESVSLRTVRGILPVVRIDQDLVSVNMGQPQLTWKDVPLARDVDLNDLPIEGGSRGRRNGQPALRVRC